jgi:uncharacterized protein YbjT (DUF2867 family)
VVTVFGGSGFVGKHVVRALARQGWRVRVAVRNPAIAYDLKPMGDVGQIQVVRCDVRKEADIAKALDGASACVNLVGILYQTLSQKFDALHRQASAHMAQICAAKGITAFVQMSAIGANPKAASAYASTKGLAEEAVRKAIPGAVIVRPSIIFGAQDGFFTMLAGQMQKFPAMPAIGGGNMKFQPVYVSDVAAAIAKTLGSPSGGNSASAGQTYELGGPEVYAFKDLIKYVGQETLNPRPLIWMPFVMASLIGVVGDIHAGLKGILAVLPEPLLTTDQVILLHSDNVVSAGAKGLGDLGIAPTAVESIVPTYLWRFRKNGQFAVVA